VQPNATIGSFGFAHHELTVAIHSEFHLGNSDLLTPPVASILRILHLVNNVPSAHSFAALLGVGIGHYRPSGHYLRTADDIKQIGALVGTCAPDESLSLSRT